MARKNAGSDPMDEFTAETDNVSAPESEVAIAQRLWSDTQLREMDSFDAAIAALQDEGLEVARSSDEIGSGFSILDAKDALLGVPFLMLEWRFNPGKYENEMGEKTDFVSVTVVTTRDERFILNDGSTGIAKQLREYSDRTGKYGPMYAEKGLRVSRDYTVNVNGRDITGTTYYVA